MLALVRAMSVQPSAPCLREPRRTLPLGRVLKDPMLPALSLNDAQRRSRSACVEAYADSHALSWNGRDIGA